MMQRICLVFCFLSLGLASAFSQFSKTVHNSIEADSITTISIDVAGEVEVDTWAGNTILVESNIKLYNATKGVFTYFVETKGRYNVLHEANGNGLRIYSQDPVRQPIQIKGVTCTEDVAVKILIPKKFVGEGLGPFTRSEDNSGR